jgi:hypothetical protein
MFHVIETSIYAQFKLCLPVRFADAKMIVMILIVSNEPQKHLPLSPVMSFLRNSENQATDVAPVRYVITPSPPRVFAFLL